MIHDSNNTDGSRKGSRQTEFAMGSYFTNLGQRLVLTPPEGTIQHEHQYFKKVQNQTFSMGSKELQYLFFTFPVDPAVLAIP